MIINREKLKEITNCDHYDGSLLHSRFAYKFFKDKVYPAGNIIAFRSPMKVTDNLIDLEDAMNKDFIYSEDAINFCMEIPKIDLFGGIAFQRLMNTYIGNILAEKYLKCSILVDGDDLMVQKEHNQGGIIQQSGKASVSIASQNNGAVLIHTGININAGKQAPAFAFSTKLNDIECNDFMADIINTFYDTVNDIFVASTKVI